MAFPLTRKISGRILSSYGAMTVRSNQSVCFGTKSKRFSFVETESQSDCESDSPHSTSASPAPKRADSDRPLENGLDLGIYKAILVGQVGQAPIEKRLKSGKMITLISLGTGGIRNNRRPLDNEEPREYANRCAVQWHRVCIYPDKLGELAVKSLAPGSILYVEGNIETKIFSDPITGLIRRIREVAVRRNGRILVLGNGDDGEKFSRDDMAGVGYY